MTNYQHIKVNPIASALGAEIVGVDLSQPLDGETLSEIQQAWLEHLVLFFRDQNLKPDEQKTFGEYFGELKNELKLMGGAPKDVDPFVLTPETGKHPPGTPKTETLHIDHSSADIPNKATILQALICPEAGADTLWVSCYAAYEALSEPMKQFVEGLTGLFPSMDHDKVHSLVTSGPEALKSLKVRRAPAEHPLVHTHPETGRKALYVDFLRMWSIKDLQEDESKALINYLEQHSAKPEFQCRFHWQPGSLAIWDNRCTLHKLVSDKLDGRRVMQTVRVEDTVGPALH